MKQPILLLAAILLAFACTREPEPGASVEEMSAPAIEVPAGSVPGVIRVKFKEEPALAGTKAEGLDLSALGNYTMTRTFPPAGKWEPRHRAAGLHLWYDIHFDSSLPLTKAGDAVADLEEISIVEFVPQTRSMELEYPFNDPDLPIQWHYQNPGGETQWAEGCDVNAFNAWKIETGKPEVIVAINDKGVDYNHEDLMQNLWVNQAELNGKPGEDDDNNGYVDDIYGYSFMTTDGSSTFGKISVGDHGTHVAGTVAAVNNNGLGGGGVAGGDGSTGTGVRLMITQTLDDMKNASMTEASFVYAADNGAVLINCSWGFTNPETQTPASYMEAIDYFNANAGFDENGEQVGPMAGGLIIFAAGNEGIEVGHPSMEENVFAVAALSANFARSYYTNYGTWVDICAPGGDANRKVYVYSTLPDNQYGNMQGSSMAAPHATGVAALIISHYGAGRKGFTRDKLIYLMQSTANKKALEENGSYADKLGAGLIDAYAALMAETSEAAPNPVTDLSASVTSNNITLNWTVPAAVDGETAYAYDIFYSKKSLATLDPTHPGEGVEQVQVYGAGKPEGSALTVTLDKLEFNTDYHIRVCAESLLGRCSVLTDDKTVRTGSNSKPVVTPLDGTSMTLAAYETGSMRFRLTDPDGDALSFEGESLPGVSYAFADGVLTVTVNALKAEDGKTHKGSFTVTDGYDSVKQSFSYTIKPNHAPTAKESFTDQIYTSVSESRSFDLTKYFSDADGEPLTYTVKQSSTSIIVNASVSGNELTLTGHSYGSTTVTVMAADARGESVLQDFRVLVRDASRPYDLYPNPVKDYLNIRSGEAKTVDLTVSGKSGAVVFSATGTALDPFAPLSVDMREQPGGVYYVQIGDERYTIVKQ